MCSRFLAGVAGLEPTMRESKSLALPLGDTPVLNLRLSYSRVLKTNAQIIPYFDLCVNSEI